MYDYVPGNSSHPAHTKQALVKTELVRLLKTNSFEAAFEYNRDFFIGKLKRRGHEVLKARRIADDYPYSAKRSILERNTEQTANKKLISFKANIFRRS